MIKVKGLSIKHPLGETAPPQIEQERLETLVQELRNGDDSVKEEIILGHIRLAFSIASRYARTHPEKAEVIVSESIYGIIYACSHAKERLIDNNITPYIASNCHRFISHFLARDFNIKVPLSTLITKKREGKSVRLFATQPLTSQIPVYPDKLAELQEVVQRAIETEMEAKILELRVEGFNDREIAEQLECTKAYVNLQRKRIKERLRKWL